MKRLIPAIVLLCLIVFCFPVMALNIQDNFQFVYQIVDLSGDHVTGQTVTLKIKKVSNGYWYDFNDDSFKESGWTSKSTNLTEDSTEGYYYYTFNPPAGETSAEQYLFVIDNSDATYGDHQSQNVAYNNIGTSTFDVAANEVTIAAASIDAVWDETLSDHLSSGSTGEGLNNASSAGNPWTVDVSSGYTGQAGEYLRNVKDATDGDKESGSYTGIEKTIRTQR